MCIRDRYYEYLLFYYASSLNELGKLKEAEKALKDILDYQDTPTTENNFAKALLGTLHAQKGQHELARELIKQAIDETQHLNVGIDPQVNAYLSLAKLELMEDNPTSSIENLDYVFELYEKEKLPIEEEEIFATMSRALERLSLIHISEPTRPY